MKKIILIYFIMHSWGGSLAQLPVHPDTLYTFIKYNSVLRNGVNWDSTDSAFKENIQQAKTLDDTMKCFTAVLETLNDYHSQIFLNNKYYGNYPRLEDSVLNWMRPLRDKSTSFTNKLYTLLLAGKFAYIRVPAVQVYDGEEINAFAQALHDSICRFNATKAKGFIIDLRLNGGGNIYPMLSGLSSLLGDRIIGYETDADGSIVRTWELKDGNFIIGGHKSTSLQNSCTTDLSSVPVAVLTGPVTVSSGSMTAIAFRKRPNTIFIGEPTANGYTTSNGYFQFAPNLTLNFATNYVADRQKVIYKTTVDPDIFIYHGDNFELLSEDKKIIAALQWLQENSKP